MIVKNKKIELYRLGSSNDSYEELRFLAASKLLEYSEHTSASGSCYISIGDLIIRITDHQYTSSRHDMPDYNLVNKELSDEDVKEIERRLDFPEYSKQKAFSLFVNQTIHTLKKILPPYCYDKIIENEFYSNTYITVIKVKEALDFLAMQNINDRNPVRQETYSCEDYCGF